MSQPQRNDKDKDCESPSASGKTSAAAALEPINDDTSELTRQTTTESNKDPLHIANSTTSKRPHNDSSESRPRQRSKRQSVSGSGDSQTTQGRGIRSSSTSLGKLSFKSEGVRDPAGVPQCVELEPVDPLPDVKFYELGERFPQIIRVSKELGEQYVFDFWRRDGVKRTNDNNADMNQEYGAWCERIWGITKLPSQSCPTEYEFHFMKALLEEKQSERIAKHMAQLQPGSWSDMEKRFNKKFAGKIFPKGTYYVLSDNALSKESNGQPNSDLARTWQSVQEELFRERAQKDLRAWTLRVSYLRKYLYKIDSPKAEVKYGSPGFPNPQRTVELSDGFEEQYDDDAVAESSNTRT